MEQNIKRTNTFHVDMDGKSERIEGYLQSIKNTRVCDELV
jgi:hypothetical protein